MRSRWRNQFQEIENASKLHERVREILCQDPYFKRSRCFQEVPVSDICEDYPDGLHRYDWFLEDLGIVLELHGSQHYKLTNRGGVAYNQAARAFKKSQARDAAKEDAAIDAGFTYIAIPYTEYKKLTPSRLKEIILDTGNTDE